MSLQDDRDHQRRRKSGSGGNGGDGRGGDDGEPGRSGRRRRNSGDDVGNALRSAYQRMMDEDIPPEMLDLLGKLG